MYSKLLFSLINAISIVFLIFLTKKSRNIKESYGNYLFKLMVSAAFAVLANILVANSQSMEFAQFSFCLYFASIDWIVFYLCLYIFSYTEYEKFLYVFKRIAVVMTFIDCIAIFGNLLDPYMFLVYTKTDLFGEVFYLYHYTFYYTLHLGWDYALILIALVYLIIALHKSYGFYKLKYGTVILVIGFIVVLNLIYMAFSLMLDWSVMFYVISCALIYYFAVKFVPRHMKSQFFGMVADNMNEGLIIFDKDNKKIYDNMVAREAIRDDLDASDNLMDALMSRFEKSGEIFDGFTEYYSNEKKNEVNRFKVTFHKFLDKRDRTLGSFFIFDDVTQEHIAYGKLEEARQEADRANSAKSVFLANMSHEIRTPINSILGMNEMILRESKEERTHEYAQNILSASNNLLFLINDILDFSKIEAEKLDLILNNYSFQEMLRESYVMLLPKAEQKNLALSIDLDEKLPRELLGDKNRVMQIVINIISNAIKYTHEGNIWVKVTYEEIGNDEIKIFISVKDTGIGISEENQKYLFNAFQRVDVSRNRNIEGTGLGLAISKQLAEMMGGTIEVESQKDKGSTFTICMVQEVVDYAAGGKFDSKPEAKQEMSIESFSAPDAKVLVVDDVAMNVKVIKFLLERTKMQVDTALDGNEAFNLAKENKYDLILMDHMMPEPDGIETFKMIRNSDGPNRETPVIVLTANAIAGAKEEYMEIGFDDYLSKPVIADDLDAMVLKYISM